MGTQKWKAPEYKVLGYPGNYGFIPQCDLDKSEGGDGFPLDIIVLGPAVYRGQGHGSTGASVRVGRADASRGEVRPSTASPGTAANATDFRR